MTSFSGVYAITDAALLPSAKPSVLQQARARLSIPMVAIGGINADNCAAAIAATADLVAVVNPLLGSNEVAQRTTELNRHFQLH